jgi:DNA polymerase elongation subunit (family B)
MRILICDIETAPILAHTWGLYNVNVSLNQVMESGRVLCFAAKWTDSKQIMFHSEFEHGREEMLKAAWDLFDQADVVVGWNSKKFDCPWLQGEWARMGWTPPSPFAQVDLCDVVKRTFRLTSNKLDYVASEFLGHRKESTGGHGLWVKCLAGDPKAWALMRKYNKKDVQLTGELYERLLPWVKSLPNPALYNGTTAQHTCPQCASTNLTREGYAYTALSRFQRYRCSDCGRWSRSGKRVEGVDLR